MAIYRRSSRRPLLIAAGVAGVAGLVLGIALGRLTAPDLASQIDAARADVAPIVTSLDVVRDEYPKLLAAAPGTDAGGAPSAMARAQSTFAAHSATWSMLDATTTAALGEALTKLNGLLTARAPLDQVQAAVDAAQAAAALVAGTAAPA